MNGYTVTVWQSYDNKLEEMIDRRVRNMGAPVSSRC